jgi:uncharacterized membrane protein YcaP (DUF421 family)
MESIFRGIGIYVVILILFRISGKRTLSEVTTFDFVLLLIISEATQEAMLDVDHSFTNSALLVLTLVGLNILVSLTKNRWPRAERVLEGAPVPLMWDGRVLHDHLKKERVGEEDILHAARENLGLERLDQVKHAVLEPSGGITVIPR